MHSSRLRLVGSGVLCLLVLALVGAGDFVTGTEVGFSAFYFLPVLLATWLVGDKTGYALATASAGVWFALELTTGLWPGRPFLPAVNALLHLVSFALVVNLASRLRRVLEHERQLQQTKNHLLGMAAHDLRNPLTAVMGYLRILRSPVLGSLNEKQQAVVERIAGASAGLAALIDDLLDVAVIEAGGFELHRTEGSLRTLVEERLALHQGAAETKSIRLVLEPGSSPQASFDPRRISQVVDNLLSNAIKFSPAATEIRVRIEDTAGGARVLVRDQGPGISPEDQGRLFVEFQRLSARPTGGESSTGLGLAICQRILQAHGGTCEVNSALGKGAEFSFTLPGR